MQELAILLSSIAGAASAIAVKRLPRGPARLPSIGAGTHMRRQLQSLQIEKDILNKTIARLYERNSDLTKIQRDRLLLKYQRQLGIILAKLERLEAARRHPDLGPVGDGLITLMDQKLSQLDSRLYELSSRITASGVQAGGQTALRKKGRVQAAVPEPGPGKEPPIRPIEIPRTRTPVELTTLTPISAGTPRYPFEDDPRPEAPESRPREQPGKDDKPARIGTAPARTDPQPPGPADKPPKLPAAAALPASAPSGILPAAADKPPKLPAAAAPPVQAEAPQPPGGRTDEDEDDLEAIKRDILKTLSKLEQAEVE